MKTWKQLFNESKEVLDLVYNYEEQSMRELACSIAANLLCFKKQHKNTFRPTRHRAIAAAVVYLMGLLEKADIDVSIMCKPRPVFATASLDVCVADLIRLIHQDNYHDHELEKAVLNLAAEVKALAAENRWQDLPALMTEELPKIKKHPETLKYGYQGGEG